jgi:hypothetical protein
MVRVPVIFISFLFVFSACSKEESPTGEQASLVSSPITNAKEPELKVEDPSNLEAPRPAPVKTEKATLPPVKVDLTKGAGSADEAALELVRAIIKQKVEKARSLLYPLALCSIAPKNEQAKCREITQLMHERLEGFSKSAPGSFNPGSVVNLKHRGPEGVTRFLVQPVGNPSGRGPQVVVAEYKGRFYGSYPPDNRFPIQTLPTANTPTADDLKAPE